MKESKQNLIYFETYGCSANQNNTEIMKGILDKNNFEFSIKPEKSDFIIINTCVVKEPTEKKIERRISDLSRLKKPIIVTGCMVEVRREKLLDNENVYVLANTNIKFVSKFIQQILNKNKKREFRTKKKEIKINYSKENKNPMIGITQISEGCLGECSFCLTRIAKGKLFSFPKKQVISSVKNDLKNGCKEIWLTSQDNASYGLENKKLDLVDLLKEILNLKQEFFLRIGMMNLNNVKPILSDLIELYKHEKMFKFLHLPLQSGSNKILKKMNRYYTKKEFINIVEKFKNEIPKITLATDIIIGFPGETEKDFQETLEIIKKTRPNIINISRFWPMKGTKASELKQISREIIKKRTIKLLKIYEKISKENNEKHINWKGKVIIDEIKNNNLIARNIFYKPIYIENINPKDRINLIGKFVRVKITNLKKHYFIGKLI
jgi:threonylcarbamoyladenosine tRNA methylthiotransferase CDKAL1